MHDTVLPKLKKDTEEKQAEALSRHDDWTISLDGWTDSSGNSIVAVMLLDGETQHFVGCLRLGNHHSAVIMSQALQDLLGENIISKCKAFVTDSPSVMTRLRADFCAIFPHVTDVKCALHVLNLIMQDFIKHETVSSWAKDISALVAFFSSSSVDDIGDHKMVKPFI